MNETWLLAILVDIFHQPLLRRILPYEFKVFTAPRPTGRVVAPRSAGSSRITRAIWCRCAVESSFFARHPAHLALLARILRQVEVLEARSLRRRQLALFHFHSATHWHVVKA